MSGIVQMGQGRHVYGICSDTIMSGVVEMGGADTFKVFAVIESSRV